MTSIKPAESCSLRVLVFIDFPFFFYTFDLSLSFFFFPTWIEAKHSSNSWLPLGDNIIFLLFFFSFLFPGRLLCLGWLKQVVDSWNETNREQGFLGDWKAKREQVRDLVIFFIDKWMLSKYLSLLCRKFFYGFCGFCCLVCIYPLQQFFYF